jgi:hypothetical protein
MLPCRPNPYKIRTNPYKSDHFRKAQFFNPCKSTTYNFNALKCTDFPVHPARNPDPILGGASSVEPLIISGRTFPLSRFRTCEAQRLRVEFPVATKFAILDKMRLFETETERHDAVLRTNRKTFLRPVSFCPVGAARQASTGRARCPQRAAFGSSVSIRGWEIQNEKK